MHNYLCRKCIEISSVYVLAGLLKKCGLILCNFWRGYGHGMDMEALGHGISL